MLRYNIMLKLRDAQGYVLTNIWLPTKDDAAHMVNMLNSPPCIVGMPRILNENYIAEFEAIDVPDDEIIADLESELEIMSEGLFDE